MDVGIQSLWIILTVMVPGIVFYGTFRILLAVLGISFPFVAAIDASEYLSISVIFAIMFTLQIFGIVIETIAFKIGPYKHKDPKYQEAFEKRYEIIATMDPDKDYHIERIVSQFFMSHNIAVGMVINLLWVIIYEFFILNRFDSSTLIVVFIFSIITLCSLYIPYNRFEQSCKALHAHIDKLKGDNIFF